MKKMWLLTLIVLLLAACGGDAETDDQADTSSADTASSDVATEGSGTYCVTSTISG